MFGFGKKREERSYTQSSPRLIEVLGLNDYMNAVPVSVTTETALGVPAVWTAVNLLSGTIAGLPLHVYERTNEGRKRITGGVASVLHDAVNDEMTSFAWRKYSFERVFTTGRAFTFIERNGRGQVVNLWPLNPVRVTVERSGFSTVYRYAGEDGRRVTYAARDIIDIPFMLRSDGFTHKGPIAANRDAIWRAIAATQYSAKFLSNGGVPPFAITGNFQSGAALQRASDDLMKAVEKASKENRQAVTLPLGLEIKPIGGDPEKSQLVETQRFVVEEIARIYSIPPVFLQDLTHGTFSNTEQQDLHFVKHTIKRWVEQAEQEMTLKLFGRGSNKYVEFNLDGLLRGDFKTRMEGYAAAIQHGVMTPNEARTAENRPMMVGADRLFLQGAMMPIEQTGGNENGI